MFDSTELPTHPVNGLRAIAVLPSGRAIWPIAGGSGEAAPPGLGGGDEGVHDGETGTGEQRGAEPDESTDTVDFWKGKAREQERRAKANAAAVQELADVKADAEQRIKAAENEVSAVPAKVAEALKGHLIERHGIDAETAELLLTATEPGLLLKQVDQLLSQTQNRRRTNYVPDEGKNTRWNGSGDESRDFVRDLFGNSPYR